ITLAAAYVFGKMLATDRDLRRLLGVGTTICGGSAIAALASVIDVDENDLAYAISTVFAFNIVAVLIFPWIGHALALSPHAFGLWAGTAVNDTSSVVAAGFSYDRAAGNYAVIVKLTRTLLIVPLVLFYAGKRVWSHRAGEKTVPWRSIVPWFILWFVLAVAVNSILPLPESAHAAISQIALILIIFALAGVGLSVDAKAMRAAGFRPLLLGLLLWATIALSSLGLARVFRIG
ncbi:MAG TPA: putative sulfate exporter family transporter, partial [Candidatus Baltobacteraceae bacterium]|nr:putative sulfate exporter family transporter [Candidatus Baltobacteraceae bacterium]